MRRLTPHAALSSLVGLAALATSSALALGCVSVTPYAEVRDRLPPEKLLEVGGRSVYVEQAGVGEPLILLHGFGASSFTWRRVVEELAPSYRLVAPDLHGFGYSERPRDAAAYTVEGQLALVLGVMDRLGISSAHVAGHSYGGALAIHLAWRHPERVRSLVLVDSAGVDYPWKRRHVGAVSRPVATVFVRALGLSRQKVRAGLERSIFDDRLVTPELVEAYFERLRIEGVGTAYWGLSKPTREPRLEFEAAELDLPVLLVWGAEDTLVGPEVGRRAADLLPRAEYVELPETGHLPPEERPVELARRIAEFLARWTVSEPATAGGP